MKLSLFLSIVFSLQISATGYSQQIMLKQEIREQTVRNVLKLIESKSEVRFFYQQRLQTT
ncbi:MAG: hypothetical protein HC905_20135 [Bacteroidales bacterium]|nr:hypothetical protein [Bacteroidales bacterium]